MLSLMWFFTAVAYSAHVVFWDAFPYGTFVKSCYLSPVSLKVGRPFSSDLSHQEGIFNHRTDANSIFLFFFASFCTNSNV